MQHPLADSVSSKPHADSTVAREVGASSPALAVDALDYHLPADRIATHPAEPRDSARMLVVWRTEPARIEHRSVRDLPNYLRPGDALVFNNTAVAPARLEMRRESGGRVEGLFLEEITPHDDQSTHRRHDSSTAAAMWQVMLRSGGRIVLGERLTLVDRDDQPTKLTLDVADRREECWIVELHGECSTQAALDLVGRTPLPPYILKARREHHEVVSDADDQRWYQTVYADRARRKSVAAPTAGLHFTPGLLERIEAVGVRRIDVTLHVGPGTFKPVTAATLEQHPMHSEWYEVNAAAMAALREARCCEMARIIAVGTTSARTLESLPADALNRLEYSGGCSGLTDLLIAPPHRFQNLDGLLTNFHLPRSTLLALVAAMIGLDRALAVYREAIAQGYRFYSYGDAMLILP